MCRTPRYLHICPCSNPNCSQRNSDPMMTRLLPPGKGHVLWCEVQPQTWDYCDRWFYEQPYEVILNAFIDPKDYCPDFKWKNMKQTDPICQECLQETARSKEETLAKLRARWDDTRVAVPYQYMPSHYKISDGQKTQAQGRDANISQDGVYFEYTGNPSGNANGNLDRNNVRNMQATQGYDQYLSGSSYPSNEPETREQLEERIKFLKEQIGSLEALDERPNPPSKNRLRTFGVTNTRNPFNSVGKSGKPAITADISLRNKAAFGAIGSERKAARSDIRQLVHNSEIDDSRARTSNPFGVIGQPQKPPGNSSGSSSETQL
ncbi:hypothetical protein LY78DRAFT_668067 [Colletotrichum sublineola]|uniref:Uncharacterized protein n=1 Tax=Colletotrichum sublineola TaxID=1173701 RepID=A0A066WUE6_COLSU|nr:hypothetical protein LY78DRAFT_668067 [Colletotrichum sublineola]KDN60267.1 hypothetical protein CSUB01_07722 [Colletotrichum sublineola]